MADLPVYTVEHVARLANLSVRRVLYWANTGVFEPTLTDDLTSRPYSRLYSFRDVVGLRTLGKLRERVSLQSLRAIGVWLKGRYKAPWSSLRFYVLGRDVLFDDPQTGEHIAPGRPGQKVLEIELEPIARETEKAVKKLHTRGRQQVGRLERHRYVAHNATVLAGTRIPTSAVWAFHEDGFAERAILREYPTLRRADVRAAIKFEARKRHIRQRAS